MHGANAGASQHHEAQLGDHGHVHRHRVALAHPGRQHGVRDLAHLRVELGEGYRAARARLVAFPDDGGVVGLGGQVAVHAAVRRVQLAVQKPFGVASTQRPPLNLRERRKESQVFASCFRPKGIWVGQGRCVLRSVFTEVWERLQSTNVCANVMNYVDRNERVSSLSHFVEATPFVWSFIQSS